MKTLRNPSEIKAWLESMGISNYTIHSDNSVSVDGSVNLAYENDVTRFYTDDEPKTYIRMDFIPVEFKHVSGYFSVASHNLTTLKNSPVSVGTSFICSFNNLKTLEHCPKTIGDIFSFIYNNLETLDFYPSFVGGHVINIGNNC